MGVIYTYFSANCFLPFNNISRSIFQIISNIPTSWFFFLPDIYYSNIWIYTWNKYLASKYVNMCMCMCVYYMYILVYLYEWNFWVK